MPAEITSWHTRVAHLFEPVLALSARGTVVGLAHLAVHGGALFAVAVVVPVALLAVLAIGAVSGAVSAVGTAVTGGAGVGWAFVDAVACCVVDSVWDLALRALVAVWWLAYLCV